MKKIFTLAIIALMGAASMQAQNIIINNAGTAVSKDNGSGNNLSSTIVAASTVKSFEVLPAEKTSAATESEGSYVGKTKMSFTMLPGVMPETIAGNTDTVTVTPIGGNRVLVTFASEMSHAILTQNAYVKGAYYRVVASENEAGDSIVFDNRTSSATDYVQASMNGPVSSDTKYYPCKVYGSINKETGAGEIHMDTQFGAMGNVYFTFTSSAKAAKEE